METEPEIIETEIEAEGSEPAKKSKKNPHDGHRKRMRERVLKDSKHSFSDFHNHEILEMLLYYTNRQKNTNQIGHDLIDTFGSFHQVFEAPLGSLSKVKEVGTQSAFLIKLCREITVRCIREEAERKNWKKITSVSEAVEYFRPKYLGMPQEVIMAAYLDNQGTLVGHKKFSPGQVNNSSLDVREIVQHAVNCNAASVILAHNHPNGTAYPSNADYSATNNLNTVLHSMKITLFDHLIFGVNGTYFSMKEAGTLSNFGRF